MCGMKAAWLTSHRLRVVRPLKAPNSTILYVHSSSAMYIGGEIDRGFVGERATHYTDNRGYLTWGMAKLRRTALWGGS